MGLVELTSALQKTVLTPADKPPTTSKCTEIRKPADRMLVIEAERTVALTTRRMTRSQSVHLASPSASANVKQKAMKQLQKSANHSDDVEMIDLNVTAEPKTLPKKSPTKAKLPQRNEVPATLAANSEKEEVSASTLSFSPVPIGESKSPPCVSESISLRPRRKTCSTKNDLQPNSAATPTVARRRPKKSVDGTKADVLDSASVVPQAVRNPLGRRKTYITEDNRLNQQSKGSSPTIRNVQATTDENVSPSSQGDGKSMEGPKFNESAGTQKQADASIRAIQHPLSRRQSSAAVSTAGSAKSTGQEFISIPQELKLILIDDLKFVHMQKKLYAIPIADNNVAHLIEDYVAIVREAADTRRLNEVDRIFRGIMEYFRALLHCQLLYEEERVQYTILMNDFASKDMSEVYPPIYLLRLLVRLNNLLNFNNMPADDLKFIVDQLHEFLKYLVDNKTKYLEACPQ